MLAIVPVLVGGGLRLFPDGVAARFGTAGVTALEHGAIGLHLRRARSYGSSVTPRRRMEDHCVDRPSSVAQP